MPIFFKSYTENGYQPFDPGRLDEKAYADALRTFVILCTDILITDFENRTIYLAKRQAKPMAHWWYIGGRMMSPETKEQSVVRCFNRETKVLLHSEKFRLVAFCDHLFKDRQQEPQDVGCHTASYIFALSVKDVDLERIQLDRDEYQIGQLLKPFTREDLVREGVYSSIIDVYDQIFG